MSNEIIVAMAFLNDEERAKELIAMIDGAPDTVEKAGAAIELYCLGTGTTLADAVAHFRESTDRLEEGSPSSLGYQWLQENHPELF